MKQIRIGILGCGYWGPNLARTFSELKDAVVVTVCDKRPERLRYIGKRFPHLKLTTRAEDIFRDKGIDAVAVATPVSTHFSLATKALQSGKHLLLEKPMVPSSREAASLIQLARERKRVLMVGSTFLYSGAVNKMREVIRRGDLGKVRHFDAVRVNLGIFRRDINTVWDLAPHDLSILFYTVGQFPNRVMAIAAAHIHGEFEDVAHIILRFASDLVAHIHVSWLAPVKTRRIVVSGSKKMLIYDDVEPVDKIKIYDEGVVVPRDPKSLMEKQLIYRTGDMHAPKLDTTEALKAECDHFAHCVQKGATPRSDGESGLKIVRVLEAIQSSIRASGREVRVDL